MRPPQIPMGGKAYVHRFGDSGHQPFGTHPNVAGSPGGAQKGSGMAQREYQSPKSHMGAKVHQLAVFTVRGY